jgi:phenylacetate-CoA ligase
MSVQSLVMSRPRVASYLMSHTPESIHQHAGIALAHRALRNAVERTTAYPTFLMEHGVDPSAALSMPFGELPTMSRHDYVDRFRVDQLVRDGTLTTAYTIERSSGYSGETHYWFRTPEEDSMFPQYMEFTFRQFYRLADGPTLVIVALALGTWTSGEKVAQAMREIAAAGKLPLTVMSPGNDLEEILQIARDICPYYSQTVLLGYPPFAKVIIDEGIARGIDWKRINLSLGIGGEGFSVPWRHHIVEKLRSDPDHDLLAITGAYGAADLGMTVGREYPLSIVVRQLCAEDASLARDLFGTAEVPNLFQYSPSACFIEEAEGELVFTVDSGIPLVRYRICDRGGVVSFGHVMEVLHDHAYDPYARLAALGFDRAFVWQLPFFHCLGRTDGAILLAGVNLYPENVAAVLDTLDDPDILGFKVALTPAEDGVSDRLLIMLEHRMTSLQATERRWLAQKYLPLLTDGLARVNREYRDLLAASPRLAEPLVKVYPSGHGPFAADAGKIKRKYVS